MGPPYSSPWACRVQLRTLLEKVVDLRTLQFWSNQTLAFLTFTDLHYTGSNCLRLSSSIFEFGYVYIGYFYKLKLFLDACAVGPVFPRSSMKLMRDMSIWKLWESCKYITNYLFIYIFVEIRFEYKCQHPECGKDQVWAEINVIGADVKGIGVRNARNIRIILQTMAAVEDAVMLNIS